MNNSTAWSASVSKLGLRWPENAVDIPEDANYNIDAWALTEAQARIGPGRMTGRRQALLALMTENLTRAGNEAREEDFFYSSLCYLDPSRNPAWFEVLLDFLAFDADGFDLASTLMEQAVPAEARVGDLVLSTLDLRHGPAMLLRQETIAQIDDTDQHQIGRLATVYAVIEPISMIAAIHASTAYPALADLTTQTAIEFAEDLRIHIEPDEQEQATPA